MLNQKCGTKCAACETEQPRNERKLDVSVGADGNEALAYSRIGAGGFKFGGLRLQGHPDGSSVSTIFEIYSLKREREHERLSLKEGSILQPLR